MAMLGLSRLEKVDLRTVWQSEAGAFTPWLALPENLQLLGETIGIDLELEAQEKDVGPFPADLLCKDTANDAWVLVENQLERTDHGHLGQLLTYAAGLKAVTIVWVAQRFTEEHRAALDWLNEITDESFNFFGLEVELWRIADSLPAPKFNIVSHPNDWTKKVTMGARSIEPAELTENRQLQLAFWGCFREFANEHAKRIKATKPLPQHWMNIAIGRSGFHLSAAATLHKAGEQSSDLGELRAAFILSNDYSKACYALLEAERAGIEQELQELPVWHNSPGRKVSSVSLRRPAALRDRTSWPELCRWLVEKLDLMHAVFQPRALAFDFSLMSQNLNNDEGTS